MSTEGHGYTCAYCTGDGGKRPHWQDRVGFVRHMATRHHGLPYEAHERSAGAAPLDGRTNEQQMIDGDRLPEPPWEPRRSTGAAPLDPERHREAMTLLRMANPRMAIGGASADAWLGEVSAFLREAGTEGTDR